MGPYGAVHKRDCRLKISILGASRGTGAEAVKIALERGHRVTAFARNPDRLALENANLTKLRGDFHQSESVDGAVRGHDSVIITASATSLRGFKENVTYFSHGTAYAIEAMKRHGVRRLVVLSACGTGDSRQAANFLIDKLVISLILKWPYADHERQEKMVRESGLDWVIARPGRLTDGPPRGKYMATTRVDRFPRAMSRADLADFLVSAAAETEKWIGQAVQLGGWRSTR
jgi:putative NADH-flavin reductase